MDLAARDRTIRVGVVVALVAGVLLITLGDTLLTTIGVVVTILGLMSLMAVVRNRLVDEPAPDASEPPAA